MQFLSLHGTDIATHLEQIAQLRIDVFREFPYLYDGTLEYEINYLQAYIKSQRSLVLLIKDGDRAIGATTALPLSDADAEFHAPFTQHGIKLEHVYYFGESVLLPQYRGRAYGHRFFDARESYAKQLGYQITCFCAVLRNNNHPLKPMNYVPHDNFWKKRGLRVLCINHIIFPAIADTTGQNDITFIFNCACLCAVSHAMIGIDARRQSTQRF